MNTRNRGKLFLLCILLLLSLGFALARGSVSVPLNELFTQKYNAILYIRAIRALYAIVIGAGLSICGLVLQAMLKNPLADPYILGTSSGAGLGTLIGLLCGLTGFYVPMAAFLGALVSIILVYIIARDSGGRINTLSLILSGAIVGMLLSGIITFITSIASDKPLHPLMWWILGSLEAYDLKSLLIVGGLVLAGTVTVYFLSQDLNAIALGEEEAIHLGINAQKIKKFLFVVTALITGALVSVSGTIGFVGLITPHMMRFFVGHNHKILVPATWLAGATFLVLCDTLARSAFAPLQVPIGVVTALVGTPLFIVLLKRNQKQEN